MKIEENGEEKICVTLSSMDMSELEITYEDLDYSNIETRRVIWTILDEAKKVLGKPINPDNRLLIQASPYDDGGCFLQFTYLPEIADNKKKRFILKKDTEPLLFCAFNDDAFIDSLALLKENEENLNNVECYKYQSKYYLVLQPKMSFSEKIIFLFSETGHISPFLKKEISNLYEHGVRLTLKNQ